MGGVKPWVKAIGIRAGREVIIYLFVGKGSELLRGEGGEIMRPELQDGVV